MSEVYKCMVCGFTSETPGDHCGQAMVKQVNPETPASTPAPAAQEAPATEGNTTTAPTPSETPAEKQEPSQ